MYNVLSVLVIKKSIETDIQCTCTICTLFNSTAVCLQGLVHGREGTFDLGVCRNLNPFSSGPHCSPPAGICWHKSDTEHIVSLITVLYAVEPVYHGHHCSRRYMIKINEPQLPWLRTAIYMYHTGLDVKMEVTQCACTCTCTCIYNVYPHMYMYVYHCSSLSSAAYRTWVT